MSDTDITARLRHGSMGSNFSDGSYRADVAHRAADEIERLRSELGDSIARIGAVEKKNLSLRAEVAEKDKIIEGYQYNLGEKIERIEELERTHLSPERITAAVAYAEELIRHGLGEGWITLNKAGIIACVEKFCNGQCESCFGLRWKITKI